MKLANSARRIVMLSILVVSVSLRLCFAELILASRPFTFKDVEVGETRKSALPKVDEALMHYECPQSDDVLDDVLFYNSTDPEKARVIPIRSEVIDGELRVAHVFEIENYLVIPFYSQCLGIQWPEPTATP
jgi:hypothetical protein